MYLISPLTSDSKQSMTLVLPDTTQMSLEIVFVPMQYGWFITELSYATNNFTLNGLRITNNPNMLYPWKNLIPFGLACFSTDNREPSQQEDFSSGASKLYLLSSDEVEELTEFYSRGN